MRLLIHSAALAALIAGLLPHRASAQITQLSSFDPPTVGSLCSIGLDPVTANVWIFPCFGSAILGFSPTGDPIGSVPRPGESANDVDVTFAPASLLLNATPVPRGTLLFLNGESGPVNAYAVDKADGTVLATLATSFGTSHVVGGAYHAQRGTFFFVQDNVPNADNRNRIAEVNSATGAVVQVFAIGASFNVSFGDLDVSSVTGNLFVVSSAESGIAEFTPAGAFVREHALPTGVSSLSGIALDCARNEAYVSSTSGAVIRLGAVPCGTPTSAEAPAPAPIRLLPVWPNPARDAASVSLHVDQARHVRVEVYDARGRAVGTLHDGLLGTGEHAFALNADLPAGTYVVHAISGSFAATRRVVVVR